MIKLKVRGFRKETLKKYEDVKENPLCAISPKNQKALKVSGGKIKVNKSAANLIKGRSDKFIGMTKALRDALELENGQVVEVAFDGKILKVA